MNVRYFEMSNGVYWFGGGIDLTPHYIDHEQATFFHNQLFTTCAAFGDQLYTDYKKWADDYFYIPHRKETRGIGGIFFDRLNEQNTSMTKEKIFDFVKAVGLTFAPTYVHLMNANKDKKFTPKNKEWQLVRRSRYAEFNLVYDKGTKFGLDTDGRIESILMSMPPTAQWFYDYKVEMQSPEQETLNLLKKDINWINV
jgi:coproporphyrinogen III oxidase